MRSPVYFSLLTSLLVNGQLLAAPPTTPAGLRADVYSDTAAELFWNRSNDPDNGYIRGYEISQNGEVIALVDALSYFTDTLIRGESSTFSIVAVDFDGERSGNQSVTVIGGGDTSATVTRPAPPENLTAQVYSATAIELFWDRAGEQPLSYEVFINGALASTTTGTSFFTDTLSAGRTFTLDVIAVDNNGQRSIATNLSLSTTGSSTDPIEDEVDPTPLPAQLLPATNLRLSVYSGSAAELFWDRSAQSGEIEVTEIRRNGTSLATTRGTSFFDDTRTPGTAYRYEVVFQGYTDAASAPAVLSEGSTGSEPPVRPDPPVEADPILTDTTPMFPETSSTPSPKNITLSVYSDSTAELNWTRPFYGDGIETNEIFRDGELLEIIPGGGNSYLDTNRVAGKSYRYEIVAINRHGRASSVFIDSGIISGGPVLDTDPVSASGLSSELAASLDTTFHLLQATPLEKLAATIFRLEDPVARGLTLVSRTPDFYDEDVIEDEYACPNGGSWFVTPWNDVDLHSDIRGVDCGIGPITLSGSGQLTSFLSFDGVRTLRGVLFGGVVLLDSRDNSRIEIGFSYSGYHRESKTGFASGDGIRVERSSGNYGTESFYMATTNGAPKETDLNVEGIVGGLAGNSRIRSRETVLLGSNGHPASGAVSIVQIGSSFESYDISASNGNPDTFTFTATNASSTTAYEIPWSDTRSFGTLDPWRIDVGF